MGCSSSKSAETDVTVTQPPTTQVATNGATNGPGSRAVASAGGAVQSDIAVGGVGSNTKSIGSEKRRAGVSAETASDQEARASTYKKDAQEKSAEAAEAILKAVAGSALFSDITDDQKDELVNAMFEAKFTEGQTVITQGDVGDNFYIVNSGEFKAYLKQKGNEAVKSYTAGGTFGELALMYNVPRAATVKCTQQGAVWGLDRSTFRHILQAANKELVGSTASFLQSISLLSPFTDAQRDALGSVLEELQFGAKETVVREGDVADALFLIKSGECIAYKAEDGKPKGKELGRMGPQDFFGESSLEKEGETRAATIVTATKCTMYKLTRAHFTELFGDLRDLLKQNFTQKVLGSMELFRELSPLDRDKLVDSLKEEPFHDGEKVLEQGTKGDAFYIIKAGSVSVTIINEAGESQVVKDRLGPSEYFGEMALLKDEPRMATVTATSSTTCFKLDRATFESLLGENIGHDILQREADRRRRELARAQRPPILMSELKQLAILGVGTFGRVKLVLHEKDNNRPYALKCMRKGQVIALKQVEHVMNEKKLLDLCDHPFLLRLAATFQDDDEIYMLLELALGGELFSVLRERNRFEEPQSRFYASCVGSAFSYMHEKNIVYRDLKPENLLFDETGYLKVVDFGFAKMLVDRTWTLCGTPEYLAPEIITNKGHNLAVDWWAFAILIFEMLVGQPPFCADDPMDIYQKILRNRVTYPSYIKKDAKDLLGRLLQSNPVQRLGSLKRGSRDVLGHAFFKPMDFAALLRKELAAPYVPTIKSPTDTSNFDDYEDDNAEDWSRFNDKRQNLFKGF